MNTDGMSNLETIKKLCEIAELQNRIIQAQASALEQLGAAVMEDERASAHAEYIRLLGADETPDDS